MKIHCLVASLLLIAVKPVLRISVTGYLFFRHQPIYISQPIRVAFDKKVSILTELYVMCTLLGKLELEFGTVILSTMFLSAV